MQSPFFHFALSSRKDFDNKNKPDTYVRELNNGLNTFIWKVSKDGCSNADTVSITNRFPTIAVAPDDFPVCLEEFLLSGNRPEFGDGKWEVVAGGAVFENPTLYYTKVSELIPGDNIFRYFFFGKCSIATRIFQHDF